MLGANIPAALLARHAASLGRCLRKSRGRQYCRRLRFDPLPLCVQYPHVFSYSSNFNEMETWPHYFVLLHYKVIIDFDSCVGLAREFDPNDSQVCVRTGFLASSRFGGLARKFTCRQNRL
jgi:hypothetical protein